MNTSGWKNFAYSEIFYIEKGKRLIKADMIPGDINYIGATDRNNGVTAHIANNAHIFEGNKITVSYNGSIAEAFYQQDPFWASDDINVLSLKKGRLNKNIAIFLTTIINKEKYRFNYGRKWDKQLMLQSTIKLPVNESGTPDWDFMESFVASSLIPLLPPTARAVWNGRDSFSAASKKLALTDVRTWRWFRYDEIFEIRKGFYNKKPEDTSGSEIPFIGATDSNNGITARYSVKDIDDASKTGEDPNQRLFQKIFPGNGITVSNDGSIGFAFYQEKKFTCSHSVNPLYLKGHELNRYIAMFLCTLIEKERYRWAYGRKWRPKRMPASRIKLPVNSEGYPDWEYMENYIKGLPYSDCL